MTDEIKELRDWAARKMVCDDPDFDVWVDSQGAMQIICYKWTPDTDLNQCFRVIRKLKDWPCSKRRVFTLNLEKIIAARYPELTEGQRMSGLWNLFYMEPVDILKAARAAEE